MSNIYKLYPYITITNTCGINALHVKHSSIDLPIQRLARTHGYNKPLTHFVFTNNLHKTFITSKHVISDWSFSTILVASGIFSHILQVINAKFWHSACFWKQKHLQHYLTIWHELVSYFWTDLWKEVEIFQLSRDCLNIINVYQSFFKLDLQLKYMES
jgi:hypothetical protein